VNRKEDLLNLKKECGSCQKCSLGTKLVEGLDPHVFSNGKVPCDIMVVAEAPGKTECEQKKPLVGKSGQFYNTKILGSVGLTRMDVYTTNSCLCRPDEKNRKPAPEELDACFPFLAHQVNIINPKLIITLGVIPLYSVCDLSPSGITKIHGQLRWSRDFNGKMVPVFPMFHPSYCLRGSGLKEMDEDISKLKYYISMIKLGQKLDL